MLLARLCELVLEEEVEEEVDLAEAQPDGQMLPARLSEAVVVVESEVEASA